jgi:hypothetical protein
MDRSYDLDFLDRSDDDGQIVGLILKQERKRAKVKRKRKLQ